MPEVKVSVFGVDSLGKPFSQMTTASELTDRTACLDSVEATLTIGEIVGVSHDGVKARFRVLWVGKQGQVRVEALEPEKRLWKTDAAMTQGAGAPVSSAPGEQPVVARPQTVTGRARRRFPRYLCSGGAKVGAPGTVPAWARLKNLGPGGCYLETAATSNIGTSLSMQIGTEGLQLQASGIVRCCHPGFGMGVEFLGLAVEAKTQLDRWSAAQPQQMH